MQSEELFAPKLFIQHIEQSSPPSSGTVGRGVYRFGNLIFDRVTVQVPLSTPPPPLPSLRHLLVSLL